jgi:ribosomal protein S18 acetylase RimI-like enzyme
VRCLTLQLRLAILDDLDFLVGTDLLVDREDAPGEPVYFDVWGDVERAVHRANISAYITCSDKCAWVYEDTASQQNVGMLLVSFRDRPTEPHTEATDFLFRYIDESILPPDGRFCEVFQLWVRPAYRRKGLATAMKRACEIETRRRGITLIYTHTRERNTNVVELNRRLGYVEIRRGPMWDAAPRVCLVKKLE